MSIFYLMSQLDQAIETGGQLLTGRSDALIILVSVLALAALWIWKVVIPERNAHKSEKAKQLEIQHTQAQTLAALSNVSAQTSEDAYASRRNSETILATKEIEVSCLRKIDEQIESMSIADELSKIEGMLKLAKDFNRPATNNP